MKMRIFSFLTISSLIMATSAFACNADEIKNDEVSESALTYIDEKEFDTDDEYYFFVNFDHDDDEEYLASDKNEDQLYASCAGGKCPKEMIERLRREKKEQRAKRRNKFDPEYDEDLSDEPPSEIC